MKANTKQLLKVKFSDAFGISYFVMRVWDAQSLKSQAYNYLGTNIKFIDKVKRATKNDIEGARSGAEYIEYYVIPTE